MRVLTSNITIRREPVAVIRPADAIEPLFVSARADGEWRIFAGESVFAKLAPIASLMADRPHDLFWIPRAGVLPVNVGSGFEQCDLVLCHRHLQLRPADWPSLRRRIGKGRLEEVSAAPVDESFAIHTRWRRSKAPPGADLFDFHLYARTVFLAGSPALFRHLAYLFDSLTDAQRSGDHTHVFCLARHEHRSGSVDDLTIAYFQPEHWSRPISPTAACDCDPK